MKIVFCEECGGKNIVDSKVMDTIDEQPLSCQICRNLISRDTIISYSSAGNGVDAFMYSLLFIDDDLGHLQLVSTVLEKEYNVNMAPTGKRGLELAEKTNPNLILLDVNMPDLDGYEVCAALKANKKTSHIPIIFVTAKMEDDDEYRGLTMGAVDYITKPFDLRTLHTRIAVQLKSKLMLDDRDRQSRELNNMVASLKENCLKVEVEQEMVLQEKSNLEKILDAVEESVIIQDNEKRITWANKTAGKILKITDADLIGLQCHEVFQDSKVPCCDCPLSGERTNGFSKPLEMYSDRLQTTLLQVHLPLFNDDGELTGMAHMAREKTAAASKVDGEEDQGSGIGTDQYISDHFTELNDIISTILIGADTLCTMKKDDDSLAEINEFIGEATDRLRRIADELKETQADKSL